MKFNMNLVPTCILSVALGTAVAFQISSSFAQGGKSPLTLEELLRAIEDRCVAVHHSNKEVIDRSGRGPEKVAGLEIQCTREMVDVPDLDPPFGVEQGKPAPGIR
jgi:hypothetical protein